MPDVLSREVVEGLDPGIRELVLAARAAGFETRDSGDGRHKFQRGVEGIYCPTHPAPHIVVAFKADDPNARAEMARFHQWAETAAPGMNVCTFHDDDGAETLFDLEGQPPMWILLLVGEEIPESAAIVEAWYAVCNDGEG